MSESADWARTLVMHIIKAIEPTAKCLNIRFDFIVGWFLVVLHAGTLEKTRYEDASRLLRFCDKGRTSQALPMNPRHGTFTKAPRIRHISKAPLLTNETKNPDRGRRRRVCSIA